LGKREVVKQMYDQGVLKPGRFPTNKQEEEIWERVMGISMMQNGHHLAPYYHMFKKTLMGR